jgi:hypothetical protein
MVDEQDGLPTGEQLLSMFKRSLNKDPDEAFNEIFGSYVLFAPKAQPCGDISPEDAAPARPDKSPASRGRGAASRRTRPRGGSSRARGTRRGAS